MSTKSFLGELAGDLKKQASKTSADLLRRKSQLSSRGLLKKRNNFSRDQHSKSLNRVGDKKTISRQKSVINNANTRNEADKFLNYDPKTVTKRVGGGYSSFAVNKELEESTNVQSNTNKTNKVKYSAISKRKS
jgi:hypothetical protein